MKRGRKRKSTRKRHPGGQLVRRHINPAEIAAQMPHRRGLGPLAVDQRAECELGRMALRGLLEDQHVLAGTYFARERSAYLATISPPRRLGIGSRQMVDCGGCLGLVNSEKCICAYRKAAYEASARSLQSAGRLAVAMVKWTALLDRPYVPPLLAHLWLGLEALAKHYGLLTKQGKSVNSRNIGYELSARP
jgi:hypothetical protein